MGNVIAKPGGAKHALATPKLKPRFQKVIEAAEALTLDQREALVDVLKRRNVDARRLEIAVEIKESLAEYDQGNAKHGTVDELLKDLDS